MQQLWATDNLAALKDLREAFDAAQHSFSVHIKFMFPKEQLFNKKGQISSRVADLSNIEKALIDVVFTNQFYGENRPAEILNINADDKYITRLFSTKVVSEVKEPTIKLSIKIIPNGLNVAK